MTNEKKTEDQAELVEDAKHGLLYVQYSQDKELEYLSAIRQLISKDLSEPYSIYVYRYFLYQWGDLCYMVISCKQCRCREAYADTIVADT